MIGFIGCGNMGGTLARVAAQSLPNAKLLLSNRSPAKAEALAKELKAEVSNNETIARSCGFIFLGVKPQMAQEVLAPLAPILAARETPFILVSMMAGLTTDYIRELAGPYPVIRMMPNTPAGVGLGVIQFCARDVSDQDLATFRHMMSGAGLLDELPEHLINAANCISGCGVAFVCLLMEALADGGVACGLPRDKANLYAAHTVQGMGALALAEGKHFGFLKDQVCSPGGTTIQGIRALEKGSFRSTAMEAVIAAFEKTEQMGKR